LDPYKILGIESTATDEEVKAAYRELARKYHPDNYRDNPLADLAEEKMKEINLAYDTAMRQRKNGGFSANGGQSWGGSSYNGSSSASSGPFAEIRRQIENGNLAAAESMLANIPDRTAEWCFLAGTVYYRRGWYQQARQMFATAARMEPSNPEYNDALRRMEEQPIYRTSPSGGSMTGCDVCSSLLCADCCCECMGGDLIRCC
jgi:hypothetical protein